MLSDKDRSAIEERLRPMRESVVVEFFESTLGCDTCAEVKQLLQEVCELNNLLQLNVHNIYTDEDRAKALNIDKAPVLHITDDSLRDTGIRFYGAPSGYEFATLLEDILMVSSRDSGLQEATKQTLQALTEPVELTVFVTPTCPYCPAAVHLAHKLAYESPAIVGSMVECTEFPDWASQFDVYGVPKTVMNQSKSIFIEGAVPESALLKRIMEIKAAS